MIKEIVSFINTVSTILIPILIYFLNHLNNRLRSLEDNKMSKDLCIQKHQEIEKAFIRGDHMFNEIIKKQDKILTEIINYRIEVNELHSAEKRTGNNDA